MKKLNKILGARFEQVWYMIHMPYEVLFPEPQPDESPISDENMSSEQPEKKPADYVKSEFYKHVLSPITTALLSENMIQK